MAVMPVSPSGEWVAQHRGREATENAAEQKPRPDYQELRVHVHPEGRVVTNAERPPLHESELDQRHGGVEREHHAANTGAGPQ